MYKISWGKVGEEILKNCHKNTQMFKFDKSLKLA